VPVAGNQHWPSRDGARVAAGSRTAGPEAISAVPQGIGKFLGFRADLSRILCRRRQVFTIHLANC